ncbi:MAG: hypothetical protein IJM92_10310 [Fibrobacter sp.]|uniref:hypothetical protein n=1 Tax=Fibrobacter sp. TaxID=35828 RepID=UPI0025B9C73E|nr:hypothetical protein [Fibrobacter sp.]MBQ7080028.1 hypothetical protein [Fibrobacter sp.]
MLMFKIISLILLFFATTLIPARVLEWCAYFAENPNEYSLHPVINGLHFDNVIILNDSLANNQHSRLEYDFKVPHDSLENFMGGCALSNDVNANDFNFYFKNARERLKHYYGKKFNVSRIFYKNTMENPFEKKISFVIKGECRNKLILAEYCIDYQGLRLYKTKNFDFLPRYMFSEVSETGCDCEKNYSEKLTSHLIIPKFGKKEIEPILYKGCDEYYLYDFVNIPFAQILKDSIYNLLVENHAEIQHDSIQTEKDFKFYIRINGKCP